MPTPGTEVARRVRCKRFKLRAQCFRMPFWRNQRLELMIDQPVLSGPECNVSLELACTPAWPTKLRDEFNHQGLSGCSTARIGCLRFAPQRLRPLGDAASLQILRFAEPRSLNLSLWTTTNQAACAGRGRHHSCRRTRRREQHFYRFFANSCEGGRRGRRRSRQ